MHQLPNLMQGYVGLYGTLVLYYSDMEMVPETEIALPVCKADQFARHVDDVLNGAAVREARESTDETQDFGADLGEGSAYLDESSPVFASRAVACAMCQGRAFLRMDGSIVAPTCDISKSCESDWITKYPNEYREEDGSPIARRLVCGAEVGCRAIIGVVEVDGTIEPVIKQGVCQVTYNGERWREIREESLRTEKPHYPDGDIEKFDGEEVDPNQGFRIIVVKDSDNEVE